MFKKVLLFLFPIFLFANEFETTLEDEIHWLEEETFVVSASKIKENIKKAPGTINIIDQDMIKNTGAKNFLQLLNKIPGINISQTYVYMHKIGVRGIQGDFSKKVLVLLDGHSLNIELLNGGALGAYENFPIELIKRIEVVKGPASALYGENAFSALVNIITKKSNDIKKSNVNIKLGSNNTKQINYLNSFKFKDYNIITNLNYLDTDGDSTFVEKDSVGNSGSTKPSAQNKSFYFFADNENNGVYLKSYFNDIENGSNYGISYSLNDKDTSKRKSGFVELGIKKNISKRLNYHARVYYDYCLVDNYWQIYPNNFSNGTYTYTNGMISHTTYDSYKYGLENLLTYKNKNYKVISGISYEEQELKNPTHFTNWNPLTFAPLSSIQNFSDPSTNFIDEEDRKFWALYSELIYDLTNKIRVTLGVRHDHYNDFGGVTNPRVALTWEINRENNLKFLYGQAFRAPTFAELYNKNNASIIGNKNLEPEKIKTYEMSLENTKINNLKITGTLFFNNIKDSIILLNNKYQNADELKSKGLELELKYNLYRGSFIMANYTYQEVKNKKFDTNLNYISNNMAYLALNYRINRTYNLYTDVKYLGKQKNDVVGMDDVSASYTVNTTLLAKNFIKKDLNLKFSVFNLFDEKTYDANPTLNLPTPNRTCLLELNYSF